MLPARSALLCDSFEATHRVVRTHPSDHFIKAIKHWPSAAIAEWVHQFAITPASGASAVGGGPPVLMKQPSMAPIDEPLPTFAEKLKATKRWRLVRRHTCPTNRCTIPTYMRCFVAGMHNDLMRDAPARLTR